MIRLSITFVAASIVLRFIVPDAGCYYLYSSTPGQERVLMEASGWTDVACNVALTLPAASTNKLFYVSFDP